MPTAATARPASAAESSASTVYVAGSLLACNARQNGRSPFVRRNTRKATVKLAPSNSAAAASTT